MHPHQAEIEDRVRPCAGHGADRAAPTDQCRPAVSQAARSSLAGMAGHFQSEQQQCPATGRTSHAAQVEGLAAFARLGNRKGVTSSADNADRQVEVENPAPVQKVTMNPPPAARGWAHQRRHQQPGHGRDHVALLDIAQQHAAAPTGIIIAPPMPCRKRATTRKRQIGRMAQSERASGEERRWRRGTRRARPAVGDLAAGGNEDRQADQIGGQRDAHGRGR